MRPISFVRRIMGGVAVLMSAAGIFTAGTAADDQSLEAILQEHNLPGISVAVVDDYKIVAVRAAGLKDVALGLPVDENTAFSAASISKPVSALVAAMLAEKGMLDLDAPVSRYLKRWQLPEADFAGDAPITLRHLFSHTAGTSQSGFADYFPGDTIPTLIDSLNGKYLGRGDDPIKLMWAPGSRFKYSGGGYVIAQVAMEDATGKPLAALAAELLFEPLGMVHTTMYQNGHPAFPANVAKAYNLDRSPAGPGGVPIYAQTAAAGMWTTPTDMAKLMIEIQKALAGEATEVISRSVAQETTRVHTLLKAGGWSAGWMRHLADGNLDWFSHSGYNTGIGGQVMATMEGGRAIAVFGNGVHRVRVPAIEAVIKSVIEARGWAQPLITASTDVPKGAKGRLIGHYRNINQGFFSPFHEVVTIFEEDGKLMLDNSLGGRAPYELVHVGEGRFRIDAFVNAALGRDGDFLSFFREGVEAPGEALIRLDADVMPPYRVARLAGFEAGLEAYEQWTTRFPDTFLTRTWAFTRLADQARKAGRMNEALTFYRLGLHFHPDDADMKAAADSLRGALAR